jgi:hypothetical protein
MKQETQIWKFTLPWSKEACIRMPIGSVVLSAQLQKEHLCVWAQVKPEAETEGRWFEVYGTGDSIPPGNRRFVDTVQANGGELIFHVFERIELLTNPSSPQ